MAKKTRTAVKTLNDLKSDAANPRKLSEDAADGLSHSLQQFGDISGITFNLTTGELVTGHQRVSQLKSKFGSVAIEPINADRGLIKTPAGEFLVRFVRWSKARQRAANVAANSERISGTFDDSLATYLLDVADDIREEMPTVLDDVLLSAYLASDDEELDDVAPQLDRAEELAKQWKTATGQLWAIEGDQSHRLLCGDATKEDAVNTLLAEATPFMMVTDPPYGVDYDPAWRNEAAAKGLIAFAASREGNVDNDHQVDWTPAYQLFTGPVAYVCHAGRFAADITVQLKAAGFDIRTQVIWRKPAFAISRGHYHWQHEPCWYAVRKGESARWCGDRSQSTVWDISNRLDEADGKTNHGTQKPLECMARPIRNHGAEGDIVYDPFLGSGTTMLAAERLGRRCFGLEISPKYCAVILQRMKDAGCKCSLEQPTKPRRAKR